MDAASSPGAASADYRSDRAWQRLTALFATVEPRPAPRCGRVRCEPAWSWQTDLTDFDLWLAVAGEGSFRLGQRVHPVRAGTLFVLRPGDEGFVSHRPESPLTVVYVHFAFFQAGTDRIATVAADLLPARHVPLRDPSRIDMLLTRLVRLQQLPSALGEVEARLLLHQALLEAYRHDAANQGFPGLQPDPRVAAVLAHLHSNPGQRTTLGHAAQLARLSPGRFSRLFRAETGHSFRRYALDARLDRARQLLEETAMTVGDVAHALGYPDPFLLSRQFKTRFGVAPSHLGRARERAAGTDPDLDRAPNRRLSR